MKYIRQENGIFTFVNNREVVVLEKLERGEKLNEREREIKRNLIKRGVLNGN
jgi:hypothetical protein